MTVYWTIKEVAKSAGTTSRTLRHYDQIGLLKPSAVADNGYRLYDASVLIRLQRILALRELGLCLPRIQSVLDRDLTEIEALADLEQQLEQESSRLERQIATVQRTLSALQQGESPMTKDMFDGFGHEKHKDEVIERWGEDAWQRSDSWWISKSPEQQQEWQQVLNALNADWQKAAADGAEPGSDRAQELAARHVDWLRDLPQQMTPDDFLGYVKGLGEMYVNDPRFAANYGGEQGATLVRDALNIYVDKHL